jgi:hypothetical protein
VADTTNSAEHTLGPYWIAITADGAHHIKGRHGKVIRTYPADQEAAANADCANLQRNHDRQMRVLYAAAPELLEALELCVILDKRLKANATVMAAIAKARAQ